MKKRNKTLPVNKIIACILVWSGINVGLPNSGMCQNMTSLDFNDHLTGEKSITDSVYFIETNFPTTGIVAEIDMNDLFEGSFLAVGKDTLHLMDNMEREAVEGRKYSNLFTFGGYTSGFYFYPGNIQSNVRFHFIDAQLDKIENTPKTVKKKVQAVPNPQ